MYGPWLFTHDWNVARKKYAGIVLTKMPINPKANSNYNRNHNGDPILRRDPALVVITRQPVITYVYRKLLRHYHYGIRDPPP